MPKQPDILIKEVAFHRNGISGRPFYVIRFVATIQITEHKMLAIVFDKRPKHIAVFDSDMLARGEIRFTHNSWDGPWFERQMRQVIREHLAQVQPNLS